MLTITKILLKHHIRAAQFWEMGRGTRFEFRREGGSFTDGEPERERVDTEISAHSWGMMISIISILRAKIFQFPVCVNTRSKFARLQIFKTGKFP
jgi:hypothetical protein